MDFLLPVIVLVISYLIGSITSGPIIARMFGVRNLRAIGSGNIGAANVLRAAGPKAAAWVFLLDVGKGIVALLVALQAPQKILPTDIFLVCCAAAVVIGHIFPVYLHFKGGKGVNTSLGAMLILLPKETGIVLVIFGIILILTRYVSLSSIIATISLFLVISTEKYLLNIPVSDIYLVISGLLSLLIVITHRKNINRLLAGTEAKFSFGSTSNGAENHG